MGEQKHLTVVQMAPEVLLLVSALAQVCFGQSGGGMSQGGSGMDEYGSGMNEYGSGMGEYGSGMGEYGSGMGGGSMGGNMGGDMMEKKWKIMKVLKIIRKLSLMMIPEGYGIPGTIMEQWQMVVKKIMEKMMDMMEKETYDEIDKEIDKDMDKEMDKDMDKETGMEMAMAKMLGYLWKMMIDEDMGGLWDEKEDKEAMKVKVMMLMKKMTKKFKKLMMEVKDQFGGAPMEGNLPDVLGKILNKMEGGGMEDEECCPYKKIWGSMNPRLDGVYTLVSNWAPDLPNNCMDSCIYEKKRSPGKKFCFAPSMMSEAECIAGEGQEPIEMEIGSGMKQEGYGSGMKPGGSGSGMKPGGSGSGMKPSGSGSGMGPEGSGSAMT